MVRFEDPIAQVPFSTESLELEKIKPRGKSSEFTDEENAMMTVTGTIHHECICERILAHSINLVKLLCTKVLHRWKHHFLLAHLALTHVDNPAWVL
jgi:hypothetical protein